MAISMFLKIRPWRGAIALGLGAATSVLIGWGAVRFDWAEQSYHRTGESAWPIGESKQAVIVNQWESFARRGEQAYCREVKAISATKITMHSLGLAATDGWSVVRGVEGVGDVPDVSDIPLGANTRSRVECGWPLCCVYGLEYTHSGGCIVTTVAVRGMYCGPRYTLLPYLIKPVHLAADAAMLGAAWYVPLGIPAFVGARRRKRVGMCAACGYDLQGLPEDKCCPECGPPPECERVAASTPHEKH
jgi:hypothetical protein